MATRSRADLLATWSRRDLACAAILAATLGGLPSTLWSLITDDDPLAAARAAGTLLPGYRDRPGLAAGVVAHFGVSAAWTIVFGLAARRWRLSSYSGAAVGLGIAALDLGLIGRRYPAIAALPQAPQWVDHMAFGAVLGGVLGRSGPANWSAPSVESNPRAEGQSR